MIIETTVTFDKEEVSDALKGLYVSKIGAPPLGYHLEAKSCYTDSWKVSIEKNVEIKEGTDGNGNG